MSFPQPIIPLFVYGSLRPGMALWPEIRDHVIDSQPATVRGRLVWHEGMEWPLLLDGDGIVQGELLQLSPGHTANRVIVDEEIRYGYDARWMPVITAEGESEALVLLWMRGTGLGPEITGGDYVKAVGATE